MKTVAKRARPEPKWKAICARTRAARVALDARLEDGSDLPDEEEEEAADLVPAPGQVVEGPPAIDVPSTAEIPEIDPPPITPVRRVRAPRHQAVPRTLITAKQFEAARSIISYGETYAPLAFPTPAGQEGVALLNAALDLDGIADLHRLGLIHLVMLGDLPGLDRSLQSRGHRRCPDDAIEIDGVAYDGVRVIAKLTEDALDVAELVWMHHGNDFIDHAWTIAKGDDAKAVGARQFICAEWDRIRGVLPASAPAESDASDPDPSSMAFAPILRDLCATIEQPPVGRGRPRLPIGDVVFAVVMMAYTRMTGRRAARELEAFQRVGLVRETMHYNVILRATQDPLIIRALAQLVEKSTAMAGGSTAVDTIASRAKLSQTRETLELALIVGHNLARVTADR